MKAIIAAYLVCGLAQGMSAAMVRHLPRPRPGIPHQRRRREMKCVQFYPKHAINRDRFERVTDAEADSEVAARRAIYAPKRMWRKHTRDARALVDEVQP